LAGLFASVYAARAEGTPSSARTRGGMEELMTFILWLIAVIFVVLGIAAVARRQVVWGLVLIIVGLLIGPGGVSIFT
jgi:hypothetical protein